MRKTHGRFRLSYLAALGLCSILPLLAAGAPQDDAPSPAPTHYTRTLGPFSIDGHEFTVKLNVTCYKETQHEGQCSDDEDETVTSFKIEDEKGKSRFSKSFPPQIVHRLGRHLVDATLLEGREHQALELKYENLPSPPRTGESIQLFGLLDGALKPFDQEPLEFRGGLADLPPGQSKDSRHLLENDTFRIYKLTTYFYIAVPVRVNWEDFRLERQKSGEFDVADQPPYQVRPDIETERRVHVYLSPDKNARPVAVSLTPQSHVELLKARFTAAPDEQDSANDTWLEVRIDGQERWILGIDDYTALGLSSLDETGK